jgi:nucleotide-binding universal stress UspA family protein
MGEETMARIEKIMFPTDFSDASTAAIPWIVRIGAVTPSEVFIVHVLREQPEGAPDPNYHYQVPEYARLMRTDAEKQLHELSSRFPADLKTHKILLNGDAAEQILKAVKEYAIDLIVMATRGETGWRNLLFGSVAEKVIKSADCPVLSIRKPESA